MPRSLFPFFLLSNALPCSIKSALDATHWQPPPHAYKPACLSYGLYVTRILQSAKYFFSNWGNFFS